MDKLLVVNCRRIYSKLSVDDVLDTGRLWRVIRRYKSVIFTLVGLFGLIAVIYSLLLRPMYTATSIVRVNQNTRLVSVGNDVAGSIGDIGGGGDYKAAATSIKMLPGGGVGRALIEDFSLQNDPEFTGELTQRRLIPSFDQLTSIVKNLVIPPKASDEQKAAKGDRDDNLGVAVGVYKSNVSIEEIKRTNLLRICYTSFEPETAAKIVNNLVDTYNKVESSGQQELAKAAQATLNVELINVQKKLELSEREMTEFSRKTGIVDLEDSNNIMNTRVVSISQSLLDVQRSRRDLEILIKNVQGINDQDTLVLMLQNDLVKLLQQEVASLKAEYNQLSGTYLEDYPKLKSLSIKLGRQKKSWPGR